ncbi:MAG: dephospho-CoA kinase [Flavobacteriaceae bacterium]
MIVGLTGGIGSGKTTVAKLFVELGVPVYDSDAEAKRLMNSSETLKRGIKGLLGEKSYGDGTLNRRFVAQQVFKDPTLLQGLNEMVHPAVRKDFKKWAATQKAPYVIQEAAIIFENGHADFYDTIILVTAPMETRIRRILSRDQTDRDAILARMAHQWPDAQKIPLADMVIENIDLRETRSRVAQLHNKLLQFS